MSATFSNLVQALPEPPPSEPAWLSELRSAAARELSESGLPTRKTEAWRFTPLRRLQKPAFKVPKSDGPFPATEPDPGRIISINGRLSVHGTLPEGVQVRRLSEVLSKEPERLEGHLGEIGSTRDFSALNAALFDDGLVIQIDAGSAPSEPIWISHHAWADEPTVVYPRAIVLVGEGAECTLIESFVGEPASEHLRDEVMEIRIEKGARLGHVRVHHGHERRAHLTELAISIDADARYELGSVVLGGSLVRVAVNVDLRGRGAETNLTGIFLAADGDVVDHHTRVEHHEGHCRSDQNFRGVLAGRGHGVFDGIIVVHRDAQRTDAHMQNRNLLLSDHATIHTKPHLEIDADDVACSHGATVGALDDDQLFYLRTRGIPEETARAMLTYAFIRENIESLPSDVLRDEISAAVLGWLPNGDRLKEMFG